MEDFKGYLIGKREQRERRGREWGGGRGKTKKRDGLHPGGPKDRKGLGGREGWVAGDGWGRVGAGYILQDEGVMEMLAQHCGYI